MKFLRTYLLVSLILFSYFSNAQNNRERSILATATVQTDPPEIVVSWPQNRSGDVFVLKNKTEPFFQLPSGTNSFTDTDVEVGKSYEYDIYVQDVSVAGYIRVAIEEEMQAINGRLLLVIDDQFQTSLEFEIARLEADIESEGWVVDKIYVGRDWTPQEVKQKILNENDQAPLSSLLLFGHVPIPLSGNYASDGHPDHRGAWPADTYYGDLDGVWTDLFTRSTGATRPTNFNVPGDGRFDQSIIPSPVDLEVGRIDLWNMPAFGDEEDLLRNYLDKNHAFRTREITSIERALIDDNFPSFDIAPWSWRAFSTMFGEENIVSNNTAPAKDYFTELQDNNYLWSFGTGGGSFTSCGGVVNSNQYAQNSLNTIFTSLSGSYFGDYNSTNNLLRAPLASSSPTLVNFWGGIPSWAIHEMATGRHIGHCTKLTQNNSINDVGGYAGNFNGSQRTVHIALMGDPTLKMHPTVMPSNLQSSKFNADVDLWWDAAQHTGVLGYHVYRMDPLEKTIVRVTDDYITETTFTDVLEGNLKSDKLVYYVRAVSLKSTPSGTYYNLSAGTCDTLLTGTSTFGPDLGLKSLDISSEPSCSGVDMLLAFDMCGAESLTSFDIEYSIDNGPIQVVSWQGEIENGGTDIYDLLDVQITPGSHTIVITLTNPNGATDLLEANNTLTKSFEVIKGNEILVDLTTDNRGSETYFSFYEASTPNTPFLTAAGFENNQDYNLSFCLADGCYIVSILDRASNGICCASGEGSYKIYTSSETILEGGEFTNFESADFCVPIECIGFNDEDIMITTDLDPSIDVSEESIISCEGIEVTFTATGGVSYLWENGDTNPTTTITLNAFQDHYAVTVTDDIGCTTVDEATVFAHIVEPLDAGEDLSICPGGSVTLNATAGPGSFFWGDVEGASITVSPIETTEYEVLHITSEGCEFTDTVLVTVEDFEVEGEFTTPSCPGVNDASANVNPINGTPPFSYQWNTGANTASISNLIAGPYSVIVTDLYNCSAEYIFEITEPEAIFILIDASNESIAGASDGMAIANPSGGTSPYTYLWSTNETTKAINNLAPGSYSVTVTDAFGCDETMSAVINVGGTPCNDINVSLSGENPTCFDSENGSVVPTVQNAIGNVNFSWSNGFTGFELNNLVAGVYGVTVTDDNNCSAEAEIEIVAPEELFLETNNTERECFGDEAMATASGSGGTTPYAYNWSNGSTSAIVADLDAGTYEVTLTDANGCEIVSSVNIAAVEEIQVEFNISNLDCFGDENGSIEALVVGGAGDYTISWSNGAADFSVQDLPAGEISVTVTDANGCMTVANPSIETPEELVADLSAIEISCADVNDGQLMAMVEGGTSPYNFNWSNGSTDENISELEAGEYSLTIIDDNNCITELSMELQSPLALVLNVSSTNESLEGASDGTADVEVLGGTPPYTYEWDNGETTSAIENLGPGEYTVIVTDANDCTSEFTIEITSGADPCDSFSITASSSDVTCFSGADGTASVEIESITSEIFINWSTGDLGVESIDNLEAGIYTVTVSDENGCVEQANIEILEGALIEIDFETTNVICFGDENGTIEASISGGTGPYDLQWSNGESEDLLTGLPIGEYSLIVVDANGCSAMDNTVVSSPFPIDASVTTVNESIAGAADGSASLSLSGGTGNTNILWLDQANNFQIASNTLSVENLAPGDYIVLLTDDNGCRSSVEFTIATGSDPCEDFSASAIIVNELSCFGDSNASIMIEVDDANGDYTVSVDGSALTANENLIENLTSGLYEISVSDEQNCTAEITIEIFEPEELIGAISGMDVTCFGMSDGSTNVEVAGGTGDYDYTWSNGGTNSNSENLEPGVYDVIITDENDCSIELSIELTQPEEILVTTGSNPIICDVPGSIDLEATGGSNDFEYIWINGAITSFPLEVEEAGEYEITIVDGACAEAVVVMVEDESYELTTFEIEDFNICFGENLSVNVPETKFSIIWNTRDTTYTLDNIGAGDYSYTLTDDFGCTGSNGFSVFESEPLVIGLTTTAADAGDNGTATAVVNDGNTLVTYEWSTGETSMSIENLAAGFYSLTVTDEFGCQQTQEFEIEDLSTSTNSISSLSIFEIFPNPASDQLSIKLGFSKEQEFEISVIDILGKIQLRQNLQMLNGTHQLDINQLTPGSYFVNIKTNEGLATKKVLVLK